MWRHACACLLVVLAVLLGCKRFQKEDDTAPVPASTGPSAEDIQKWTNIRVDYETNTKKLGTKQEIVDAMLALIDESKATGHGIGWQDGYENTIKKDPRSTDPTRSELESVLGLNVNGKGDVDMLDCSPDYRKTPNKVERDNLHTEDGLTYKVKLLESSTPLVLSGSGGTKSYVQLYVETTIDIKAPNKPPIHIVKKVPLHDDFKVSAMVGSGESIGSMMIYKKQLEDLRDRSCWLLSDTLGLHEPQ